MLSVEELIAAGIYDPETQATTGRLELLQWLDANGFRTAEMVKGFAEPISVQSLRTLALT